MEKYFGTNGSWPEAAKMTTLGRDWTEAASK